LKIAHDDENPVREHFAVVSPNLAMHLLDVVRRYRVGAPIEEMLRRCRYARHYSRHALDVALVEIVEVALADILEQGRMVALETLSDGSIP